VLKRETIDGRLQLAHRLTLDTLYGYVQSPLETLESALGLTVQSKERKTIDGRVQLAHRLTLDTLYGYVQSKKRDCTLHSVVCVILIYTMYYMVY
jgi:hypothetical protein